MTGKRGGFGRFFVRGRFAFRGVKWRWGWVAVSSVRQIQPNPAFERDWPISVLFAACGFLNFRGFGQVSWSASPSI